MNAMINAYHRELTSVSYVIKPILDRSVVLHSSHKQIDLGIDLTTVEPVPDLHVFGSEC